MIATNACRALAALLLLSLLAQPLQAATVFGTVTGPEGLVPNANIAAYDWNGNTFMTSSDENGEYTLEVPEGSYNYFRAESNIPDSGLVGELVWHLTIEEDTEVRLFLAKQVELSGTVEFPDDFSEDVAIWANRLDKTQSEFWADYSHDDNTFQVLVPSGVYSILVSGQSGCQLPGHVPDRVPGP